VDRKDVLMVELRYRIPLAPETRRHAGRAGLGENALHCHDPVEVRLPRPVHHPHPTSSDLVEKLVTVEKRYRGGIGATARCDYSFSIANSGFHGRWRWCTRAGKASVASRTPLPMRLDLLVAGRAGGVLLQFLIRHCKLPQWSCTGRCPDAATDASGCRARSSFPDRPDRPGRLVL